ncbi:hypothetical protein GGI35DRAFT_92020 [Trichoderma velutinum]
MPIKRAGLIQPPASTAKLWPTVISELRRALVASDRRPGGWVPKKSLLFFFFFPSNAKDSLPRRNSEAETLPGAMTLAESRRCPPRWVEWILSPGKRAQQTREPCLDPARCTVRSRINRRNCLYNGIRVFSLFFDITQGSSICVNCTSTVE